VRWAEAVAGTSYVPLHPDQVEEMLLALLRRLVAAAQPSAAAPHTVGLAVGAALVNAHFTNPRTLSQTLGVLLDCDPTDGEAVSGFINRIVRRLT
jgi:hypothetical protein